MSTALTQNLHLHVKDYPMNFNEMTSKFIVFQIVLKPFHHEFVLRIQFWICVKILILNIINLNLIN